MKRGKQRIWSKDELIIAYYIARYGYSGLNICEDDLVDYVIGDTTKNSLRMQSANFRYLLGIEGYALSHTSELQREIVEELKNKTTTQVRKIIQAKLEQSSDLISLGIVKKNNHSIEKRKDQLNQQLKLNFEKEFERRSRGRKLIPKK